jgi:hypothetical protein
VGGRVLFQDRELCDGREKPCLTTTETAELWDPRTRRFTAAESLAGHTELSAEFADRAAHTATRLPDGRVLIMGGASDAIGDPLFTRRPTGFVWEPRSSRWSEVQGSPRDYHTATLLPDGRVLIFGGASDFCGCCATPPGARRAPGADAEDDKYRADAEIWDPATGKLAPAGRAGQPRMDHAAALLADGRVLIVGGEAPDPDTGQGNASGAVEIWRPSPAPPPPAAKAPRARAAEPQRVRRSE